MTTIPMKEVAAFLLGEDSLDGYWFGERHPISPFWWREHLRAALSAPATAPDEQVRRDAERVAWYENNPEKVLNIGFRWYSRNGYGLPMKRRKGFREAIDAAMKETP